MPLPIYLAMTAAEYEKNVEPAEKMAWMACHFSPYGTGLSNFPSHLPRGAMLILNDRTPVCGHDPELIAAQIRALTEQFDCSRVLLDLQRPGEPETAAIVHAILQTLPCPVGVSEGYGKDLDCPVFLRPLPLLQSPEHYFAVWKEREIWLELAGAAACYTVTESGCRCQQEIPIPPYIHTDTDLCCRYRIEETENAVLFHIWKDPTLVREQLSRWENVTCLVGLYQELG